MCLSEKLYVFDKLYSGHSAVGHEFRVSESTMCIKLGVFKQKQTQNKAPYCSMGENVVSTSLKEPDLGFH